MAMIRGAVVDRRDPLGCQSKRSVCGASIGAAVRAQIRAAEGILADDEKNLDLVRAETAAGATTQVDVLSVESQLVMDRTLLPPLREHLSVVHHALALLGARVPSRRRPASSKSGSVHWPAGHNLLIRLNGCK
jgi:hypothetical protein